MHGQFGVLIRAARYERCKAAMEAGGLRRERLTLFFSRVIDTRVPVAGDKAKSIRYKLWQRLIRFLDYPVLELSNNLAENAIRPEPAQGKASGGAVRKAQRFFVH